MIHVRYIVICLILNNAYAIPFDWSDLNKGEIDLKLPLLTVAGTKGFLACGYINVETCDKTGEACAVVSGVTTHDQMLSKPVTAVSKNAKQLGIKLGMTGAEALERMR